MAPPWVARALKSQVKRIGNAQPNGFSEIAHKWLKILHGLKKNFHERVNDSFPLLWFHRLMQTAFEKIKLWFDPLQKKIWISISEPNRTMIL